MKRLVYLCACILGMAASHAQCTYNFSATFTAAAGTGSVGITTQPGCQWTVTGMPAWLTLTTSVPITGSGTVQFTVAANTTASTRTVNLTVASMTYTVTQTAESTAPTVPTLTASATSTSQIALSWTTSTDSGGSGLAGYKVYRAGVQIATTASTTYNDTGLSASTAYCYTVLAYDNAANESAQSTSKCATTFAASSGSWNRVFGGTGADSGSVVAIDSAGSSIIVGTFSSTANFGGTSLTSAGGRDLFIAKLGADSTLAWVKRFGSTGNEYVKAIVLDDSNNIFLAGQFTGTANLGGSALVSAGNYDSYLASYTADGTHVWSKRFGSTSSDEFRSIALDTAQQNIVVTGNFAGTVNFGGANLVSAGGGTDTLLAKFTSANGTHVFSKRFTNQSVDTGVKVMVDGSDNIYMVGYFFFSIDLGGGNMLSAGTSSQADIFLGKFNSSGTHTWSKRYGGPNGDTLYSAEMDSAGELVVAGTFRSSTDLGTGTLTGTGFESDLFIAKYAGATGNSIWVRHIAATSGGAPRGLAIAAQDSPVITGYYYGTCNFGAQSFTSGNGSWDVFVAKYSSSGAPVSAESFGGNSTDDSYAVAVDLANHAISTGAFVGTANFKGSVMSVGLGDVFVLRLAP